MKIIIKFFILSAILFFPLYASAKENINMPIECIKNYSLEDCVLKQANKPEGEGYDKFFTIETLSLEKAEKGIILVNAFTRMSAYNSFSALFLFDKSQNKLFPLTYKDENRFSFVDFYGDGLTFSTFLKHRGLGDIGEDAFYKIDLEKKSLVRIGYFSTDNPKNLKVKNEVIDDKYIDENGNEDKELGYDDRSEKYKKAHKLQKIKLTEIYHEKGE